MEHSFSGMDHMDELALGVGVMAVFLVMSLIFLVPFIVYLLSLQKNLGLTRRHHGIAPGLVWLMLIPFFNIIWHFFLVNWVAKGLRGSLAREGENGGFGLGLAMCILFAAGIIPLLGFFAGIAGLIVWIIYWIKIAGYTRELRESAADSAAID